MNKTLVTDLYELTMAQTYFLEGKKDEILYFDVFFRENPFKGGFTISGGLEEIIDYVENFHFEEEDIEYLRSLGLFQNDIPPNQIPNEITNNGHNEDIIRLLKRSSFYRRYLCYGKWNNHFSE